MDEGPPGNRPGPAGVGLDATVAAVPDASARTIAAGRQPSASSPSPNPLAAVQAAADLPVVDAAHYEMLEEHARGGLGRIVRARDRRTGRLVAIKEMLGDDDAAARRFAQEAMITANLQHPAIVPVYELGRWATGAPFYAMKLVAGTSFEQAVRGAELGDRLARLPVIVSVAEALAYAHARHVIHRDLKPANVLVGAYGETVVIDWGLAKVVGGPELPDALAAITLAPAVAPPDHASLVLAASVSDQTMAGAIMGTPAYMPPEQALGEAVDERADVYAIGAMLYFLVAGAAPFADKKPTDLATLLALAATAGPTPLAQLAPTAPPDLVAIAAKAMARKPADRYRSAQELADDLRRYTTGQLVAAHRYDLRALVGRWLRRHRAPVTVAAVLLTVLVVGGVMSVQRIVAGRAAAVTAMDQAKDAEGRAMREMDGSRKSLATALYQKGRVAENGKEWARAAMYYAAARLKTDSPEARWAAGYSEARALFPQARHLGHAAWVHAAAFSQDGARVATVDDAGQLRVWSPRDGALIAERKLGTKALYAVTFAPDGELAAGGDEGIIWRLAPDLSTTTELRGHTGRVWSLAYAPAGGTLASGGEDATVRLWRLAAGTSRVLTAHTQRVYCVAWAPDGAHLASSSDDRRAWLWDAATGKGAQLGAHVAGGIRVAVFLPKGDEVVTAGWDSEVYVWRIGEAAPVQAWAETMSIHGAALSTDGTVLMSGGDGDVVHAWEISTHQLVTVLAAPGGQTSTVVFSADGRWVVTAGKDGIPVVWDAQALHRLVAVGHRFSVDRTSFAPSGTYFVTGSNAEHAIRAWGTATGHELVHIATTAACGDGVVALGETEIASACEDGTLRRWDLTGRETARLETDVWLRTTWVSPDGKTLAAGHMRGRLALIDVASWTVIVEKTLHTHQIYGVELRADGRLLTTGLDSHTRVWRGRELQPELDIDLTEHDGLLSAAWSPDGSQIASGAEDGTLAVWDVGRHAWFDHGRGEHVAKLGTVWRIVYEPDGARAFTVTEDGLVRVWDPTTWAVPGPTDVLDAGEGAAQSLAITPDGTTLAVGHRDGAIVLWDLAKRAIRSRIGGRTRDHGSCADLATAAWVDPGHRELVTAACADDPGTYAARLAARTHQRIDDDVDARWDWEPRPIATSTSAPP